MYMSSCRRVIQNFSQKLGKPDVTDPNKMMEHLNYFMKYLPEYLSKSPNRKHQHLAIMSNGKYFGPPEYMSDDLKILSNKKIIEMHSKSFCGAEYNDGSGTSPPEGVVNFTLGNKLKIGNPLRAEYWKPTFETYAELATKNELFFLLAVINRDHQRVDAIIEATFPVDKLDEDAPYVVADQQDLQNPVDAVEDEKIRHRVKLCNDAVVERTKYVNNHILDGKKVWYLGALAADPDHKSEKNGQLALEAFHYINNSTTTASQIDLERSRNREENINIPDLFAYFDATSTISYTVLVLLYHQHRR